MFATLQRRKACERSLTLLVVTSLLLSLLPVPASASSSPAVQTVQQQGDTPVPEPVPAPQWPEVGERAQYTPGVESLPAPETLASVPAPAGEAQTPPAADMPAIPELVLPAEPLEIVLGGELRQAQVGTLPLALQAGNTGAGEPLLGRVQMLQAERAADLSPLNFAFALQLQTAQAGTQPLQASQTLTAVIDYSRIPLAHVSDVSSRLVLYRASGCTITPAAEADAAALDAAEMDALPAAPEGIACTEWQQLSSHNDQAAQQLLAQLPAVALTVASTPAPVAQNQTAVQEPPAVQEQAASPHLYLPFVQGAENAGSATPGGQVAEPSPGATAAQLYLPLAASSASSLLGDDASGEIPDTLYVLGTSASGEGGDYSATPLNAVDDYQVGLFAGTFATSYPIVLPPAAAGAAPAVSLEYDSGRVEGQSALRNNQPGIAGAGWELNTGAITPLFKACEAMEPDETPKGLCPAPGAYALTLNGVSSRLVAMGGNRFRLQHDPLWQVQLLTTTVTAHHRHRPPRPQQTVLAGDDA